MCYQFTPSTGKLTPAVNPWFSTNAGDGPRHCEFDPSGKHCYLINDLESSISLLSFDDSTCKFDFIQTVPTVEPKLKPQNTCADIHLTPDGKFLYGSNRGADTLVIYRRDIETGVLKEIDTVSCGGKTPRNFVIEPAGKYLIVANQDTDNLVVYRIDSDTGMLQKCSELDLPTPVCVKAK